MILSTIATLLAFKVTKIGLAYTTFASITTSMMRAGKHKGVKPNVEKK
jgi:hypothetical protein